MKRLITTTIAISTAFLIFGCGQNSSVADADVNYEQQDIFSAIPVDVEYQNYNVKVVDDLIKGAQVRAYECNSSKELEDGLYELQNCVSKPTYITVEGGKIGDTNVTQTFPLVLNVGLTNKDDNFVVTPLTTLVADANKTEAEEIAKKFGLTAEELFDDPEEVQKKKSDINLTNTLQKVNAIYLKADADGAIADKLKFVDVVRSKLKDVEVEKGDFNVTEVAKNVEKESQEKPALFGLVFMGDMENNTDILEEIHKTQAPNKVTFLGLVFDDKIKDANITVYRYKDNKKESLIENDSVTSGENGEWQIEINDTVVNMIKNEDFIIYLEAVKDKIKLKSSISSVEARKFLENGKKLSPSKATDLIISNVTTAENAMLEKKAENDGVDVKELNSTYFAETKTDLKTYYGDKILQTAGAIKNFVDNGKDLGDYNDTYHFAVDNIEVDETTGTLKVTEKVKKNAEGELNDIKENALLNKQLQFTQNVVETDKEDNLVQNQFEEYANEAGNKFYRILAYYKEGNDGKMRTDDDKIFVREYDEIVTLPGYYRLKVCYLEENSTANWDCKAPIEIKTANFSNGYYNVREDGKVESYGFEKKDDVFVKKLNKTYSLYSISKQTLIANEIKGTEPEVLVDDFDVVDMFRRMPKEDNKSFKELQDDVKGKKRKDVNAEINRYIKEKIEDIKEYFAE